MAMPKTPTALNALRGNPGKRPGNPNEPRPQAIEPDMPTFLDPIGRREWRRVAPMLLRTGLLTEVDGAALAGYCDCYSTITRLNKALRRAKYRMLADKTSFLEQKDKDNGRANELMTVEAKINPLLIAKRNTWQVLRFFCQEFGMTPSSRGRMSVQGGEEDEMEKFLRGSRGDGAASPEPS